MNTGTLIRALSRPHMLRLVRRHLASVSGLEHLPSTGSFVLVPNHTSYFDHFLVEMVVSAALDVPTWFLTKRESFARRIPRAWAQAWYGIPVDREAPTPDTLRAVRRVLASGEVICVYPEGTRGDGEELLPFKPGAFRFALANDVPLIPLAMSGTQTVLARGDKWFRKGGRVHMAFGEPVTVQRAAGVAERTAAASGAARVAIQHLKTQAAAQAEEPDALAQSAARELDALISRKLDDQGQLAAGSVRHLRSLSRLLLSTAPRSPALRAQVLRVEGLAAARAPSLIFAMKAMAIRVNAERILRDDPDEATAHYILGRWHIGVPRVLGGNVAVAVEHFRTSADTASGGDARALAGLADAYLALGQIEHAIDALRQVEANVVNSHPRAELRRARATARIAKLQESLSRESANDASH